MKSQSFLEKLYNDILKDHFHIYDIWDEAGKTTMLNEVRSKIKKVFYITDDGSGSAVWDYKRFFTELGVDVDNTNALDLYKRFKDDERYVHNHSMANYAIEQLNNLFLTESVSYNAAFNEYVKSFYDKKKAELGTLRYKWIDGRNGEVMDPRTYYYNGKYNFTKFENDVKEFVLTKETKYMNSPNRENETLKLARYNVLLSMYGEYMYRIGIQEIPDITPPKAEELKPKFLNYWKLTKIRQGKYDVEWRTLRDSRWEKEYEEWLAKLNGAKALQKYFEAVQSGKIKAIKDIVVGTAGVTISGIVIGTSEFTLGLDLAFGLAGMGYSLDRISGGVSTLNAINDKVFNPKKEYRFVKGIIIDNYGTQGAFLYDIGNLIVNVYNIAGTLTGTDLNQVLDYLAMGMDSYEILEFINSKIKKD